MREYNETQLEQITGAIITSFINLHFLEEAERSGLFRQRVRKNVKRTLDDLIHLEATYFNEIEKVDETGLGDKLVANNLEFITFLLKMFRFNDFSKMQEVAVAYSMDKEAVTKVTDEILIKNGAKDGNI
jgi:predicted DNA-binding protein YlxM (UPF0122 family)